MAIMPRTIESPSRSLGTVVSIRRRAVGGALATLFLLGLLLLALAADGMVAMKATAATAPRVTGERHAVSGSHVAIYNLVGEIRLEPASGREVEVYVATGGPDAGQLRVETGALRGKQTLRVIYPGKRIVYRALGKWSGTNMNVDEDGTFNDRSFGREIWNPRRVQISGNGSGLEAYANLRIAVPRGQKLDVYLGAGKASVSNVDGTLLVDVASASVSSTGTRGQLTLDSGSGSLAVENAEGDISLDTGSGSVEVSNVKGGTLHVDTGSGSISGNALQVDVLNMDTGSGSIDVSGVAAARILLDTGSGSVRLGLDSDVEDLAIDTGSGDVTVYVPASLGAEFSAETGSGGIDADVPIQISRKSRDSMRGRLGDGRGRVYLETGSGSIRLASSEGRR